ncbi:MAG: MFS transporter [Hyphomicrobiaceae bacterium]
MQFTNKKTALGVSCTAHAIQDGLTATIYVLLPILAQSFGLSYSQVGLFKSIKSLSQAVLEMLSGIVTERFGEYRVLIFGLLLSGVGYASLAATSSPVLVMVFLFVIGAGTAFQHAPASALVIAEHPVSGRRGPLGIYNSSGDIGKLVFTGCFSLLIGAGLAWQKVSLAYGVTALIAAVAITIGGRVFAKSRQQDSAGEVESGTGRGLGWGIINWSSYGSLLVVVFIDTMVQAGVLVFVAFLMLAKGLPLPIATAATVVLLTGGVFGKAGCGYLADQIGVRPAFTLIQGLTAAGLIAIVAAPSWLAFILLFPLGVVLQGSTSITYGFAADLIHPRRMARGYALLYSSSGFSSVAGPLAFGLIGDDFGIEVSVYAMAVVVILSVPPIVFLQASAARESETA